jgi:hypothetical protein
VAKISHLGKRKKYSESFGMWCWRRMEKISWTDSVTNEGGLYGVKRERNSLSTIKEKGRVTGLFGVGNAF